MLGYKVKTTKLNLLQETQNHQKMKISTTGNILSLTLLLNYQNHQQPAISRTDYGQCL
jgi:hypothetical protein